MLMVNTTKANAAQGVDRKSDEGGRSRAHRVAMSTGTTRFRDDVTHVFASRGDGEYIAEVRWRGSERAVVLGPRACRAPTAGYVIHNAEILADRSFSLAKKGPARPDWTRRCPRTLAGRVAGQPEPSRRNAAFRFGDECSNILLYSLFISGDVYLLLCSYI